MKIKSNDLYNYIDMDITELLGKIPKKDYNTLLKYDELISDQYVISGLYYLFLKHQEKGISLETLAKKEVGISPKTLTKIFKIYDLPILTKEEINNNGFSEELPQPKYREPIKTLYHGFLDDFQLHKEKKSESSKAAWQKIKKKRRYAVRY